MKTITLSLYSLLIAGFSSFGQISITQADLPSLGQIHLINTAIDPTINYSITGANQNWNFGDLTPQSQTVREYKSISTAGFLINFTFGAFAGNYAASYRTLATDFDLAQLPINLPVTIGEINQFYKTDATKLTTVGYSVELNGQGIPVKSDTIEMKYKFPLTFGTTYSSRGYTLLDAAPIYAAKLKQYRQRSTTVDGYGRITTPLGTFDVIRVKHAISEQDSFNLTGSWMGFQQPNSVEYEWLSNDKKAPILKVNTRIVAGVEVVIGIEYLTETPLSSTLLSNDSFGFFPNPSRSFITISTDVAIDDLQIVDIQGKVVRSLQNVVNGQVIDLQDLKVGMYQIIGLSKGIQQVQKLVIQ